MEGLPREILDMICSYVLASDIMALHRTSQNLFEKVPLNNAFWRTRLDDGTLLPYIWDLDTKSIEERHLESNLTSNGTNWDWRGIAKILATGNFPASPQGQELDDVPLGLWNRSRIWNIVQEAFEKQILSQADNSRKDSVAEAQPT